MSKSKNMSKREYRETKKKAREQKNATERATRLRKQKVKSSFKWLVILGVIFLIGFWAYGNLTKDKGDLFPFGSVHWHSSVDIIVCGESQGIDHLGSRSQHVGGMVSHTHGDGQIHLEGNPHYMSQASLASFFKGLNIPFSDDGVWEYTNGDVCPNGSIGTLRASVNGQEIQNPSSYVPRDGDIIKIIFG